MFRIRERLRRLETRRPALPPSPTGWTPEQQQILRTDIVARDLHDRAEQLWRDACAAFDIDGSTNVGREAASYPEAVLQLLPDEPLRVLSDAHHALHDRLELMRGRA